MMVIMMMKMMVIMMVMFQDDSYGNDDAIADDCSPTDIHHYLTVVSLYQFCDTITSSLTNTDQPL